MNCAWAARRDRGRFSTSRAMSESDEEYSPVAYNLRRLADRLRRYAYLFTTVEFFASRISPARAGIYSATIEMLQTRDDMIRAPPDMDVPDVQSILRRLADVGLYVARLNQFHYNQRLNYLLAYPRPEDVDAATFAEARRLLSNLCARARLYWERRVAGGNPNLWLFVYRMSQDDVLAYVDPADDDPNGDGFFFEAIDNLVRNDFQQAAGAACQRGGCLADSPPAFACGSCAERRYCSVDCARLDWDSGHAAQCAGSRQ